MLFRSDSSDKDGGNRANIARERSEQFNTARCVSSRWKKCLQPFAILP